MKSSVTLGYLVNNRPIRPNREFCVIDASPPDISLEDLINAVTNTVRALEGDFSGALNQIEDALGSALRGKNSVFSATDHVTYQQNGS